MFNLNSLWFEVAVVSSIFAFGHIFFGHFEELTPKWKKVSKIFLFQAVVLALSYWLGRAWAFGFLGIMALFIIWVHGVILPSKGINGLTGKPREKYYALRGWDKK